MKKTKIVATIGPKSEDIQTLKELSNAGVNIFRLNFSHGSHEEHGKKIDNIRSLKVPCAIMLDTKGPEIRTGEIRDKLFVKVGDEFLMTTESGIYEDTGKISVNYIDFLKDVDVGDVICFDSGVMFAEAIKKTEKDIAFKVVKGQTNITTKRHINLFGKPVSLPTITEQDWKDIDYGISKKVDMIALSFVRTAEDVKKVKDYCKAKGQENIKIISKIENFESTQNLEDIIQESDGIMVARGDLACEIDFSKVPAMQKKIVAICKLYKKPVIIATQMLLSMVENIQPTRAEVSDVSNAIFEQVDAVMTSDETTKSDYPVNVIEVMSKIIKDTEEEIYACDCEDDCDCGCGCCCESENTKCNCNCSNEGIFSILPDSTKNIDAFVILSDKLDYVNNIAKARYSLPILSFVTEETIANNLNLIWNTSSYLINKENKLEKNIIEIEKTIKNEYKNTIKQYMFISEIDGCLSIQIKNI